MYVVFDTTLPAHKGMISYHDKVLNLVQVPGVPGVLHSSQHIIIIIIPIPTATPSDMLGWLGQMPGIQSAGKLNSMSTWRECLIFTVLCISFGSSAAFMEVGGRGMLRNKVGFVAPLSSAGSNLLSTRRSESSSQVQIRSMSGKPLPFARELRKRDFGAPPPPSPPQH